MTVKITAPVEKFTGTVAGVNFVDSVGETDDETALQYFQRQGYTIEDESPSIPEGEPGDKWTVAQLTAYAEAEGISLDGVKGKPAILTALGVTASAPSDAGTPAGVQ